MAGRTPKMCFFTCVGDVLAHRNEEFLIDNADSDVVPFFSELRKLKKPTSKLSSYIAQVRDNARGKFKKLSDGILQYVTAQGFRHGVINECMSKMPVEFVAQSTGHELTSISALYEYLNASRAMLQPGMYKALCFLLCMHYALIFFVTLQPVQFWVVGLRFRTENVVKDRGHLHWIR